MGEWEQLITERKQMHETVLAIFRTRTHLSAEQVAKLVGSNTKTISHVLSHLHKRGLLSREKVKGYYLYSGLSC